MKTYSNGRELPSDLKVEFEHRRVNDDTARLGREVYETFGTKHGLNEWRRMLNKNALPAHDLRTITEIGSKGGMTTATVYDGEEIVAQGIAVCSPFDNFSKVSARTIALGRALKALEGQKAAA